MKRIITMIALACATSIFAQAQAATEKATGDVSTEQLILRLENEGREATLKNDIEVNDRLLADNWVNINPDGSVTTKAQLIALLKAGSFKIMSIDNDEVAVRVYGDAAVVTGRSTSKRAGQNDDIITRQVRFTRVYARQQGRWQVASAHNTLIGPPQSKCPSVRIDALDGKEMLQDIWRFTAVLKGTDPKAESFAWTVHGGEITSGQGTTSITIRRPDLRKGVTVIVEVSGFPEGCANKATVGIVS